MAINRLRASWTLTLILALAMSSGPVWAMQLAMPDPLDPRTYVSPSGRFRLEVDPTDIYGEGSADYVLKDAGRMAWQGRKPFTFLGAQVTDQGVVAGFSYSGGVTGGEESTIHLVILNRRGALVLDDTIARRDSDVIDGGPEPWVNGILLDADTDRVTFRVEGHDGAETWKTFRLSDGKAASTFQLKPPPVAAKDFAWLNAVEVVKGTPFNILAWGVEPQGDDLARFDIRFALVDANGTTYWRHELSRDRAPRASRGRGSELTDHGIIPSDMFGEFEIRAVKTGERIRFRAIGNAESGVQVSEIHRGPYEPRRNEKASSSEEAAVEAQVLPTIALGRGPGAKEVNPTRGVEQFDIDSKGRFGFARRDSACALTFVFLDNEAAQEHALGALNNDQEENEGCHQPLVAWAGGSTWFVTQEFAKGGQGASGWWIDIDARTRRPFALTEPHMPRAVAGTGQGAVVLLVDDDNLADTLLWIDATSGEKRSFRNTFEATRGALHSPRDVTVTRTGDVAVLDNIRNTIEVFDRSGARKGGTDLQAKWGRGLRYPAGLSADTEGGYIVNDFGAARPIVRTRDTGRIRAEFKSRYENGLASGRIFRVRVAPDGKVWGSDGEALLLLDDRGVVVDSIGPPASIDHLGEVAAWAIDRDGRIYAADRRSGSLHVFDERGLLSRICAPPPGLIADALKDPSLSVSTDGRVLLRATDTPDETQSFLEFSPTCGGTTRQVDASSLLWNSSAQGTWAHEFNGLTLLGLQGMVMLRINRRPDRRWLNLIHKVVVADDGSLAVISDAREDEGGRDREALSIFHPDGRPRSTTFLPPAAESSTLAFDGHRIVLWDYGRLRVMDTTGKTQALLDVPDEIQALRKLRILLQRNGREAWILDEGRRVIHRVRLP